jgi:hypothetical protein
MHEQEISGSNIDNITTLIGTPLFKHASTLK